MSLNETQYETILTALADKIKEQETTIFVQSCRIEALEKTLAEAEAYAKKKDTPKKLEIR
jgi:hypothetical protein